MLQIQSTGFGIVEQTLEAKDSPKEKKNVTMENSS